jgi:hypothetical protein
MRIFPPYFESPPVAAGTSVAATAEGTGVLADGTDGTDVAAACGVAVADDPHATATINKIADTIGSKFLTLSSRYLDIVSSVIQLQFFHTLNPAIVGLGTSPDEIKLFPAKILYHWIISIYTARTTGL